MLVSITGALEAILFAAGSDGIALADVADILQLSVDEARAVCQELQKQYEARSAGLALVELAGNWQLVTRPEHAVYLRRMVESPFSANLSAAALEVVAIVAYRQPISRADIDFVRGVQSDRAVSTLVHRQLIREVARQEGPGRPILYGTTDVFLQTFGLRSVEDLPPLPAEEDLPTDLSLFALTPSLPRD